MKAKQRAAVLDAAMAVADERGWRALTLRAVAERAEINLGEIYALAPSKVALLEAFAAKIDEEAGRTAILEDDPVNDRLFDAVMARFDAMLPYRHAVRAIWRDLLRDPLQASLLAPAFRRSVYWTLDVASAGGAGARRAVRGQALSLIILNVFRIWLDDDEGQSKTMARLDQSIRRAARLFEDRGRKQMTRARPSEPAAPNPSTEPNSSGASTSAPEAEPEVGTTPTDFADAPQPPSPGFQ